MTLFESAVKFTAALKRAQPTRLCHISLVITAPSLWSAGSLQVQKNVVIHQGSLLGPNA